VLVADAQTGRFLAVNEAALEVYGYSPAEFRALSMKDLDAEGAEATPTGRHAGRGGAFCQERRHRRKDGSILQVEASGRRRLIRGRAVEVVVCVDLARQKLELQHRLEELQLGNTDLERRVSERTVQLEAINKELEAFSHSVSHDLRAPLRSVRGFSEVLLERYADKLDEAGQDFLRRARDSCQDMDNLITDLLRFSRVSQGELRRQQVDLSTLAESIAQEISRDEPKRPVQWLIEPGLKAQGDERLLRVVLDNLLRNAWKFTGKRPDARIEFGAVTDPQPAFYVRDNGAGFDMEYADKLFGMFQRLHSVRDFPGTGVGLATAQRVVNRHGGRIWAASAPEQGATFYFALPEEPSVSGPPTPVAAPRA